MQVAQYTPEEIKNSIQQKLRHNFVCDVSDATKQQIYHALALTVKDQVMEQRAVSRGARKRQGAKKLYYLSAEFLTGRVTYQNILNLLSTDAYKQAMKDLEVDLSAIVEEEPEPGLGNGGLGRLAACFLESLASLDYPAMGCSIRYEYGLFRQKMVDGQQVEMTDNWLINGNDWEIVYPDQTVNVNFYGWIEEDWSSGKLQIRHHDPVTVLAVPYDMPVVGYNTVNVARLRLWSAQSPYSMDMASFNRGQYMRAMEQQEIAAVISKVLYPDDNHYAGRELRLKQQYFFASASIQYALKDYEQTYGGDWTKLPEKIVIHINDTHPSLAIPEMMRILMDEKGLSWETAERICRGVFAYTNHTILVEAMEKWPLDMISSLLPRISMILNEMNRRQCLELWEAFPGQWDRIGKLAIVANNQVHMANLCNWISFHVNGVSQLHGRILTESTFKDFSILHPEKFSGITNGITHRRWLMQANPALSDLLDKTIGRDWRSDASRLKDLSKWAEDSGFRSEFALVKRNNKERLARITRQKQGILLNTDALFDVQAKRLHEYKRQMMNALHILIEYNRIIDDPNYTITPRCVLFGAKAAPGYQRAKEIIYFINSVGKLVASHPRVSQMIQVEYLENYSVSIAEILIPAAELSEQISTAGKEASGTGNMKFMMNGALTIGTLDGANIEISELVGRENIFIFGLKADQVAAMYAANSYHSYEIMEQNPEIHRAVEMLNDGSLGVTFPNLYHSLLYGDFGGMADPYFVLKDLPEYQDLQQKIMQEYNDPENWWKKAIINTAKSGYFSSDRTIEEYNAAVWHLDKLHFELENEE